MVEPKEKHMEKSENIYINLVKNPNKKEGDNLPIYVAPKNDKFPDKNWTIGVNIDGAWFNQAAFRNYKAGWGFFPFLFVFPTLLKKRNYYG